MLHVLRPEAVGNHKGEPPTDQPRAAPRFYASRDTNAG